MILSNVVFPEPEGPIKAVNSPFGWQDQPLFGVHEQYARPVDNSLNVFTSTIDIVIFLQEKDS